MSPSFYSNIHNGIQVFQQVCMYPLHKSFSKTLQSCQPHITMLLYITTLHKRIGVGHFQKMQVPCKPLSERKTLAQFPLKNWRLETENFINAIVSLYQQVPERFLEVAQITLREFFNAIIAGKDVDPSWKKAIYKVICKLDSEVPEIYKSPNCLQELLHEQKFQQLFSNV